MVEPAKSTMDFHRPARPLGKKKQSKRLAALTQIGKRKASCLGNRLKCQVV